MPAYEVKQGVLNGRGVVFSYVTAPSKFYYRQLIEGQRKYRTKLIANASTIEEAVSRCLDTYIELTDVSHSPGATERALQAATAGLDQRIGSLVSKAPQEPTGASNEPIAWHINRFIEHEQGRVEAGLIKQSTLDEKRRILTKPFNSYLLNQGLSQLSQLTPSFLDDYIIYRGKLSKLTRQKELDTIKDFIDNHLIRNEYLNKVIQVKKLRINKSDLTANPAITPKDWRTINNYIRNVYVKEVERHHNKAVHYWRVLFWTFTTLAKQTGARPVELLALKWKDVEIEDIGRYSKSNDEMEERLISYITIINSKNGDQREVPSNSGSLFKRWAAYQRMYCKQHKQTLTITPNTYIFCNPNNDLAAYKYTNYTTAWKRIRTALQGKLEGNKFSEKNYTIYSFRSSFIEDHISKGTDIYLLSRLAGHTVAMLQRHYDRSDIRKFSEDITRIEFGKKGKVKKVIDVFD